MAINFSDPQVQKVSLVVMIVLAGLYGYYEYVFAPKNEAFSQTRAKLETLETQVSDARAVVERNDTTAMRLELEKATNELQLVESLLPGEEHLPVLLESVSRVAMRNGVKSALFEPATPIQHELYRELPYKMMVRCGYHQLASFLADVSSFQRVIKPTGVSLSRETSDEQINEGLTLVAEVTLTTYIMAGPNSENGKKKNEKK